MKLTRHAFVVFWAVHAWVGVLISLILYAMFVAGGFTLFHGPLQAWQDPLPATSYPAGELTGIDRAVAALSDSGELRGKSFDLALPGPRRPRAELYVPETTGGTRQVVVDNRGEVRPPSSHVADTLYHLHFLYHEDFPKGFYVAGLLGVLFLLALVTGFLIHLKDLGRQLFRFRPAGPAAKTRAAWRDVHKVLGVWGLPFQTMIAFTGAVICLSSFFLPHIAKPSFGPDADRAERELYGDYSMPEPTGVAAPMSSPSQLVARSQSAVAGLRAWWIRIAPYGDEQAQTLVYGDVSGRLYPRVIVRMRATDGAVVAVHRSTPSQRVMKTLVGLHFAGFGGLTLRIVYALLTLGGCLTILSGNWIWIERRRARNDSRANRVLARLTLGIGAGLPIAIAGMLWLNRLLPADPSRGAREAWGLFAIWLAVALAALALQPTRRAWGLLVAIAGAGFAAVPILSALTQPAHLGNGGGALGWRVAGVDLGLAVIGTVLLLASARLLGRGARSARPGITARGPNSTTTKESAP